MRHRRLALFILLAGTSFGTTACVDHRKLIAFRTIFNDAGQPDNAAYSAALQAKFPSGTPTSRLETYVKSAKGSCNKVSPQSLKCELIAQGTICVAFVIRIEADISGETIERIRATSGDLSC
jgi:hypothetical protein